MTDDWINEAIGLMREGYGVEDIGVKLREWGFSTSNEEVRALMHRLTDMGVERQIYRGRAG